MPIIKSVFIIECRTCKGSYFGGDKRMTLHPGDETKLPDEISIIVRKIPRCTGCKDRENRTLGGGRRKRRDR